MDERKESRLMRTAASIPFASSSMMISRTYCPSGPSSNSKGPLPAMHTLNRQAKLKKVDESNLNNSASSSVLATTAALVPRGLGVLIWRPPSGPLSSHGADNAKVSGLKGWDAEASHQPRLTVDTSFFTWFFPLNSNVVTLKSFAIVMYLSSN